MSLLEWLLAPMDPSRIHGVGVLLSWHARMMVLAWTLLIPVGVLAARFFKIFPGQNWPRELDDHRWWNTHRGAQYLALACMLAGLALILFAPRAIPSLTSTAWFHRLLGWSTLGLGATQYAAAWLRGSKGGPTAPAPDGSMRGDHYDMSPRRRVFERLHKSVGYLALLISAITVGSGLWQANAPRWMPVMIGLWYVAVAVIFAALQKRRMVYDTYQAIWGADPRHPGNRIKPIGIGITRLPFERTNIDGPEPT